MNLNRNIENFFFSYFQLPFFFANKKSLEVSKYHSYHLLRKYLLQSGAYAYAVQSSVLTQICIDNFADYCYLKFI